jgi:hypothetical protein
MPITGTCPQLPQITLIVKKIYKKEFHVAASLGFKHFSPLKYNFIKTNMYNKTRVLSVRTWITRAIFYVNNSGTK